MVCLCLHNYLWHTENSLYTPQGFADIELVDGKIKEGKWRSQVRKASCLKLMETPKGGLRKVVADELPENLNTMLIVKLDQYCDCSIMKKVLGKQQDTSKI